MDPAMEVTTETWITNKTSFWWTPDVGVYPRLGKRPRLEVAKLRRIAALTKRTGIRLNDDTVFLVPPNVGAELWTGLRLARYRQLLHEVNCYDRGTDGELLLPYRRNGKLVTPWSIQLVQAALGDAEYQRFRAGGRSAADVWHLWHLQVIESDVGSDIADEWDETVKRRHLDLSDGTKLDIPSHPNLALLNDREREDYDHLILSYEGKSRPPREEVVRVVLGCDSYAKLRRGRKSYLDVDRVWNQSIHDVVAVRARASNNHIGQLLWTT